MKNPVVVTLKIESLDIDAHGIAHRDGKVVFVDGGLPGELVRAEITKIKPSYERAKTTQVLRAATSRVKPQCPHFGVCGGCSMQHIEFSSQVATKARVVEDQLWHVGRVKPELILRTIQGPTWAYRQRGRLSVRWVEKKAAMLIGFHEKASSFVADMSECHILPKHLSALLSPLRQLILSLTVAKSVPQIEFAVGDTVTALVLRHLQPLSTEDEHALRQFADTHQVQWWLQPEGPASVWQFYPQGANALCYRMPEFDITMPFRPTDFTQVNHQINSAMVGQAIRLLNPQPTDRIADLFCGLGNFSLPLARRCRQVVGVEGSDMLTQRAQENAKLNELNHNTQFFARNLFELSKEEWASWGAFDRVLIDPPREGALAFAKVLADFAQIKDAAIRTSVLPRAIVYISCNPSTLARDAALLVHQAGYVLKAAAAINMFPHTSHVESMALFELSAL